MRNANSATTPHFAIDNAADLTETPTSWPGPGFLRTAAHAVQTFQGTIPARPIASGNQPLYFVHHARPVAAAEAISASRLPVTSASQKKYTAATIQKTRSTSVSAVRLKKICTSFTATSVAA